jgi:hypothetical protein
MPRGPVQALAFPLFTTTALTRPERSLFMASFTGAAFTLLVVKVPAADASPSQ